MAKKKAKQNIDIANTMLQLDDIGCRLVESLDDLDGSYVLKTGIFPLDLILSEQRGLLPGRIMEVFGGEGVGKTSIALNIIKQASEIGLDAHFMAMEIALNSSILNVFDLSPKSDENPNGNFYLYHPNNGEAALNGIKRILQLKKKTIIVLDSIANCLPADTYEEAIGKPTYKGVANIMSPFIGQARNLCEASESILIMLNQIRENLSSYGKKTKEPGGRAVKFNSDWRVELKQAGPIKNGDVKIGHVIKATTVKNRLNIPHQEALFHLIYGKGFDSGFDILHLCLELGIVQRAGAWFNFTEGTKVHGQINAAKEINKNKNLRNKLIEEIEALVL